MDRTTAYTQALGRAADFLQGQQYAMVGEAWANQGFLGTTTSVDGFTCTPTTPASLNVLLTPGSIYSLQNLEATTWSSLPANLASQIMKQGLMQANDQIGITPPGTVGQSQNFLIEVQYADLDTNPVLLPYYNAANPTQPFQGAGNSGVSQNTARLGIAAVQVKAGTAATTGTQTTPTPDAGWTGIFVVIVAQGAPTITAGNIFTYFAAPFIPVKLPGIPAAIQSQAFTAWADVGTADTLAISPTFTSAPSAYATNQMFVVKKSAAANATTAPTLNVTGAAGTLLGAKSIVDRRGNAIVAGDLPASAELLLMYDGTNFRNLGVVAADLGSLKSPFNYVPTTSTTRTVFTAITGFTTFSTGSYVKKSATSNLVVELNSNVFDGATGTNCGIMRLNFGSTNVYASTVSATSTTGASAANNKQMVSGIAAGTLSWTLSFGRNDASAWKSIINPTSAADAGFIPAITNTTVTFSEIEP